MKRYRFFPVLLIFVFLFSAGCGEIPRPDIIGTEPPEMTEKEEPAVAVGRECLNYDYMKAVWVSQFDMAEVYLSGGEQREVSDFRRLIRQMMEKISAIGLNTVIFQVRPYGDSIYPSDIYPPSAVVTGEQGRNFVYDPFEIVVDEAHKCGLSLQAWINPLRLMREGEIEKVSRKYAVGKWHREGRGYICEVDKRWYLDPAYAETRRLIIDGVCEILEKYEVDGIHMDDYFYPTTEPYFDYSAYSDYLSRGGRLPLDDWRRENLNRLVSGIYSAVKSYGEELLFGISPAGNYNTAYESQYADIYTWCGEDGYIDYICPQAYFGFEHGSYDFVKVVEKYRAMIKCEDVRLVVGMTLSKAYDGYLEIPDKWGGIGSREWIERRDILLRQLEYLSSLDDCSGVSYFSCRFFFDPISGNDVTETAEERESFLKILKKLG